MTQVFEPPAELDMEADIEAVRRRYASMVATVDGEVDESAPGLTSRVVKGQTSEAWVHLYSTKDGTVSTVTVENARKKTKMYDAAGKPSWSTRPIPGFEYTRDKVTGRPIKVNPHALKCRLHVDSEDREWLDSIGLAGQECPKSNIPSQFRLQRHMEIKHKAEWATIQREENESKEQESRGLMRMQAEAMQALAQRGMGEMPPIFICRQDGCSRFFDSEDGRKIHESKPHN